MFATAERGLPWHRLGQSVKGAQTWEQAIQLAKLDWSVSKQPLFDIRGTKIDASGIFRDDTNVFLGGVVGSVYEPIQNKTAFDFCDAILGAEGGSHYESAGALGKGERVWALARIPSADFSIGSKDRHEAYLLFTTSHDGSMAAVCKITTVRVVCQNTLSMALHSGDTAMRIKHTSEAGKKLEIARGMIADAKSDINAIREKLEFLSRKPVKKETFKAVMTRLFPQWEDNKKAENKVLEIAGLFEQNDHNAIPEIRGSAYNLLNSVTEYADHFKSVRVTEGKETMTREQVRSEGALWGCGEVLKQQALNAIIDAVQHEPDMAQPAAVPPTGNRIDSILSQISF
jgi:phage/plasmid-like protein (TIGR03299 family)